MLIPSCKAQFLEKEGGEDQKQAEGTASGDGWGWAAVTSLVYLEAARNRGRWRRLVHVSSEAPLRPPRQRDR